MNAGNAYFLWKIFHRWQFTVHGGGNYPASRVTRCRKNMKLGRRAQPGIQERKGGLKIAPQNIFRTSEKVYQSKNEKSWMKTKIFCFIFYKNYIFLKYKILLIAIGPCSNRTFGNVLPYTAALSPMSQYHIPLILHLDLEPLVLKNHHSIFCFLHLLEWVNF